MASTLQRQSDRFVLALPESTPVPGPACFGWGGRVPTLADALLVVGYLGPFSLDAAGQPLDPAAARDAMAGLIGHGMSGVEAVALRACHDVADDLAAAVRRHLKQAGLAGSRPALLACGRTGGLLACAVAERLGLKVVHIAAGGGLILTVGVADMELVQTFRRHLPAGAAPDADLLGEAVAGLRRQAERTLRDARLSEVPTAESIAVEPAGGEQPRTVTLKLTAKLPTLPQARLVAPGHGRGAALPRPAARPVYLGQAQGWRECSVRWDSELSPGDRLAGPALIEAADAVDWIAPGWQYVAGPDGLARIKRG